MLPLLCCLNRQQSNGNSKLCCRFSTKSTVLNSTLSPVCIGLYTLQMSRCHRAYYVFMLLFNNHINDNIQLMWMLRESLKRSLRVCCSLLMSTVCKWLGVYLCMRESPATTPAVMDQYNVVIVSKGICHIAKVGFSACGCAFLQVSSFFLWFFHANRLLKLYAFLSSFMLSTVNFLTSLSLSMLNTSARVHVMLCYVYCLLLHGTTLEIVFIVLPGWRFGW